MRLGLRAKVRTTTHYFVLFVEIQKRFASRPVHPLAQRELVVEFAALADPQRLERIFRAVRRELLVLLDGDARVHSLFIAEKGDERVGRLRVVWDVDDAELQWAVTLLPRWQLRFAVPRVGVQRNIFQGRFTSIFYVSNKRKKQVRHDWEICLEIGSIADGQAVMCLFLWGFGRADPTRTKSSDQALKI